MSVYLSSLVPTIKSFQWPYKSAAKLIADTNEELHNFAQKIGLERVWFQDHPELPHYDLNWSKAELAVKKGALPIDRRSLVQRIRLLRKRSGFNQRRKTVMAKKSKTGKRRSAPAGDVSKLWEDKKGEKVSFGDVIPDGQYVMKLVLLKQQKMSDDRQVVVSDWMITQGEEKRKTKRKWDDLDNPDRVSRTQAYLRLIGVDVDSIGFDELDDALKAVLKAHPVARGKLVTPTDTQYCNITALLDIDDDGGDSDEDSDDSDKDEEEDEEDDSGDDDDDDEEEDEEDDDDSDDDDDDDDGDDDDDEEEAPKLKKGQRVSWQGKKGMKTGTIVRVDSDGIAKIAYGKGKTIELPTETLGVADVKTKKSKSEAPRLPVIGDRVVVEGKGGTEKEGEVLRVNKSKKECFVKMDTGKKKTVSWAKLKLILQDVE